MLPITEFFKDKKILILGFGREGRSSLAFIRQLLPEQVIGIADGKEQEKPDAYCVMHCGDNYLEAMRDYDIVLKSPGIPFRDVDIPEGPVITCQTDLFMRFADCRKIGVTGSKGKTTTSTLIYRMLCESGVDCILMGNMGLPVLDYFDEVKGKTAVIEMSSHQLEYTTASPDIAVLTNIFEEHLEHYKNGMQGYVSSKMNIARHQKESDRFIFNKSQNLADYTDVGGINSKMVYVGPDDIPFEYDNPHLIGEHNRQDIATAYAAASLAGASPEAAKRAVDAFEGIEHRMEFVGTFKGIKFYNDCIATIPYAVICAVKALDAKTLIMGGKDRGISYEEFENDLENSKLECIIGTKSTGHKIIDAMLSKGTKKNLIKAENLEEAVKLAYDNTKENDICILSPAASSYNEYKNFEEKGRKYKEYVKRYGEE